MRRSPEDWLIVDHPANCCPLRWTEVPHRADSLHASCRPTRRVLAEREHSRGAVLRSGLGGDRHRSGASFCRVIRRPSGRGRRHPQHQQPRAVLYALQSGQPASRACSCDSTQAYRGYANGEPLPDALQQGLHRGGGELSAIEIAEGRCSSCGFLGESGISQDLLRC
jgi:hypothetical protein